MTAPRILLPGATGAFGPRLSEGLVRSGLGVLAVAREHPGAEGRLAFVVAIAARVPGRVPRYRGWGTPARRCAPAVITLIPPPSPGPARGRW